jgi:soluble lytic murein transglycosylase-like protein
MVAVPALATFVAGCSMAGLPTFKPAPATVAAVAPVPEERPAVGDEPFVPMAFAEAPTAMPGPTPVDGLISKYAAVYDVPASLIRRVVQRESGFNPRARNGPYYGLMQIRHDTARSMGYRGDASGLLDAETNLKYAVKYLRGAYIVAGYNSDGAVRFYARGYYYDAKRLGLLEEAGLR